MTTQQEDMRIALESDGFQVGSGAGLEYCFVEDVDWKEIRELMDRRGKRRWLGSPWLIGAVAAALVIALVVLARMV